MGGHARDESIWGVEDPGRERERVFDADWCQDRQEGIGGRFVELWGASLLGVLGVEREIHICIICR